MIGDAGLARLQRSRVTLVGLGAVGSYATEALARAGVGALRLVDFDVVRPGNLNRQLFALHSTVGRPKAEVARERVLAINPACEVEALPLFAHTDTLPAILAGPPDLLIDAVDAVNPKVELLAAALTGGIPVISSMGAALRTDPTQVRTGPLSGVQGCPLARRVRTGLRRRGLPLELPCVYSTEPVVPGFTLPPEAGEPHAPGRGRERRVLGSLPTLTGIFGLTAATLALRLLLGDLFPAPPRP
jgi:tRNA threonylcarbamoyladenosine dehydratase